MGIIYCESLSLKNDDVKKHYIDWKENPETFLDDEYKKAISFAPEEEKLTIKSYICDFRKALNRRINRLKLETELDNKKAALKCKEYESTSNYKFGAGIIIGLLLILSGWVLFFVQSKIDSTAAGIIALILLIVGNIVFFKSEPIYEIKGYFSHKHRKEIANNDVVKLKEDIQGISTKISEFKDKSED